MKLVWISYRDDEFLGLSNTNPTRMEQALRELTELRERIKQHEQRHAAYLDVQLTKILKQPELGAVVADLRALVQVYPKLTRTKQFIQWAAAQNQEELYNHIF